MGTGHGIQHATGGGPDQLALDRRADRERRAELRDFATRSRSAGTRVFTSLRFIRPGAVVVTGTGEQPAPMSSALRGRCGLSRSFCRRHARPVDPGRGRDPLRPGDATVPADRRRRAGSAHPDPRVCDGRAAGGDVPTVRGSSRAAQPMRKCPGRAAAQAGAPADQSGVRRAVRVPRC